MSGFGFKLRIRYQDKQIEFKPFGNFVLVRDEITKAFGDDVDALVLRYNNLHNKIMFIRNEMEYIEMINNFTNELYYPDLEYADLQLVLYDDDVVNDDNNDEENEIDDTNNNNNDDDDDDDMDESTRNKHSNKFNEQKRIYYIKEKKEMQREEQRKYELDINTNHHNTTNERSKAKKKSKGN